MLKINLSPIRSDKFYRVVEWVSPNLLVEDVNLSDGVVKSNEYDLSLLEVGAIAQHPILGTVNRTGLVDYEVTLILPHGANAPEITRFPTPIQVVEDGLVELPPYEVGGFSK